MPGGAGVVLWTQQEEVMTGVTKLSQRSGEKDKTRVKIKNQESRNTGWEDTVRRADWSGVVQEKTLQGRSP